MRSAHLQHSAQSTQTPQARARWRCESTLCRLQPKPSSNWQTKLTSHTGSSGTDLSVPLSEMSLLFGFDHVAKKASYFVRPTFERELLVVNGSVDPLSRLGTSSCSTTFNRDL